MSPQTPATRAAPPEADAPASTPGLPALAPLPPAPRMSWPKRIGAVLFVLAVAGITVASLRPKPPPPIPITAATARKGPITRLVTGAGKLQPATEVKLSSNISGDLLELDVKAGDRVKKGQVLGKIDSRRYVAQVDSQEAARASAAADANLEKVKVAQLEQELGRVEKLAATGNASAAEVDNAKANLAGERARLQSAQERIAQAEAGLREARHALSLTTLVSPIDGIVTDKKKQVGERVRGSDFSEDVILVIGTLSQMEAKLEVGEHEVVFVKDGDTAEVEIDAFAERKFRAQVVEVARNATVKNAGTEAEVTTFYVRLALTEPVPGALPGMSAQASVATDTRDDAVVVPIQAVTVRPERDLAKGGPAPQEKPLADAAPPPAGKKARREPLRKVVFVIGEDGAAGIRPVETGLASDTEIEIVSGLKEGEKVVEGPYRVLSRELSDGKKVTTEQKDKPGDPKAGKKG